MGRPVQIQRLSDGRRTVMGIDGYAYASLLPRRGFKLSESGLHGRLTLDGGRWYDPVMGRDATGLRAAAYIGIRYDSEDCLVTYIAYEAECLRLITWRLHEPGQIVRLPHRSGFVVNDRVEVSVGAVRMCPLAGAASRRPLVLTLPADSLEALVSQSDQLLGGAQAQVRAIEMPSN